MPILFFIFALIFFRKSVLRYLKRKKCLIMFELDSVFYFIGLHALGHLPYNMKESSHNQLALPLSGCSCLFWINWFYMNCQVLLITCIRASENQYSCERGFTLCFKEKSEFEYCSYMYGRVPLTWFLENMRLPWQQKLFEGRNLGRVVGSFEVLGVLIGKDPVSSKHTTVGHQSRKISISLLALTWGQIHFVSPSMLIFLQNKYLHEVFLSRVCCFRNVSFQTCACDV